ncbi:unnamed protein product [Rotaria socialis]|uniref:Helix-turn-helix domain-containing protein n=1 Tax=Rotaria socialis TaxID=392032 RepID=A0A819BBX5_9BILA|nr:unnamed protein product [Rotaria socialis]CAF4594022.1 unnamed protein product [Rotaria socialis]
MAWYGQIEQLQTIFDELERLLPSGAQLTSFIATIVHFMDCLIDNQRGNLFTNIYHDSTVQPFLLPYISGHTRLSHRKWFRYIFIHACHYCRSFEDFEDFEDERIYIEAIFLANGYSLDFVEYHWRQFLKRFNFSLIELTDLNRYKYNSLRTELFSRIMARKHEREEEKLSETNQKLIQLHYLFDCGSRCEFNQKFQRLWLTILNEDLIFKQYGLKIQLNSKHCYSSNILLARSITF